MIYLDERQVGFHTSILGFPSIDGCHALVLQTTSGLFGMHIVGGERKPQNADPGWDSRAKAFAAFVRSHFITGDFVHLYGTCFRSSKRGYIDPKLESWKAEMKAHAKALGFRGPVSGFDLAKATGWPGGDSAYVEYRKVFDSCYIAYKPWSHLTKGAGNAGDIKDKVNRKTTTTAGGVEAIKVGKNHTISLAAKPGYSQPIVAPEGELDHFTV
jgi:hypothetical protein